ncbi:MFS transporter [Sphingobium nicotianae]|uniref:MFS transporter n=1 Tax=Sphingobium nicotianae TaxID=2782607 RepID=A0A9X1DC19_9SPHN|nr:MFS transporter [Sphingobium nicotianae]MBT2187315.1 MFS transporter [Sphingobium nicotianae]
MASTTAGQARSPAATMSPYQYALVALCCICNLADGFDVSSLSLIAPVLSEDWGIDPAVLGVIFTATSVGLALGAFFIAPLADRFGRRRVMLCAIGSLAVTMMLSGAATNISQLLILRTVTGLALGTLVVCLNTTVAEFATPAARNVSMAVVHVGFSLGMATASAVTILVLDWQGWRGVFVAAGLLNGVTFLISLLLLGESPQFLIKRRGPADLAQYNRLQRRMGLPDVAALPQPVVHETVARPGFRSMLEPAMRSETLLAWTTALTYSIVGYFLMSWKPTILHNAGLSPKLAAASVMISSAFGIAGHLGMGLFAKRFGERRLTALFFLLAAVCLIIFGIQPPDPVPLLLMAGLTNFFVVGAYTGLFLVAVVMYPPASANTGLGFIVGFVRVGAAVGPMLGGFLLSAGFGRMDTYVVFSAIAIVPALTMFLAARLAARRRPDASSTATAGLASEAV